MNQPYRRLVLLHPPGPLRLPDDLTFQNLVRSPDTKTIRIRFSQAPATTLDLPLTAESLIALVAALSPLFGAAVADLPDEFDRMEKQSVILKE